MDPYNHTTNTSTKVPILDTGKFEQWKFRIQQYLQHEHYALWEVIEFGDSYKVPPEEPGKAVAGEAFAKKKGRTVAITTEDMQKRRNDVKARTTLLLALPDEHQLRFSKYDNAKELWEAILKTFGGNEATKKTKKNQLKQQYGNFKAEGSETLEQTFNRLQAIVSHLEFMDVPIEKDDLNQKFLTSLAPEWLMYIIVWRNRDDLDTMSLDDLYNHLKVYEPEVQKKAGSNSQNMAFISSSNTSSGKGEVPTASVPTASSQVSTVSTEVAAASLSHDTICAYIATQSSGSQIKYEDITQIDEDDIEEMDIKWNLALLSMRADRFWKKTGKKITIQGSDVAGFDKSKVECFNCHKMGHFARECRAPRSQDRGKRESYRKDPKVEEPAPKALMAIDGIGWDWSYMANEDENHALVADDVVPTEFALMAMSSSSSSSDNEVYDDSYCSKSCRKNTENLNTKINKLNEELSDCETDLYNYKRGLSQVEARLVEFKVNETKFCERIRVLERDVEIRDNKIESLKNELEELKKEKESIDHKLAGFGNASKDLNDLLESQKSAKDKTGVGFNEYTVVPPPPAQVYSPPQRDLSWTGLPEFVDDTVTDYTRPTPSVDVSKDVRSDLDGNNTSIFEQGETSGSNMSRPMIKFVKESGCPNAIKINNTENTRKPTVKYAEMYRDTSKSPKVRGNQRNWNNLKSQQLGKDFLMQNKACYKCGYFDHLASNCGIWVAKGETWPRGNYSQNNVKSPSTHKSMTPRAVLLKSGSKPIVVNKPKMNVAQPTMTSFKTAHSNVKRPFERKTAAKNQIWVPKVPTGRTKIPTVGSNVPTAKPTGAADLGNKGKAVKASARWIWKPKENTSGQGSNFNGGNIDDKGYWDSGCSRHMTGNISYLSEYEPYDGGYVSFGHGGGKITGKGTIKTGKLEFENVYFVKELKYNLFSVSQICDNKNSVLFTDSECLVLGKDFKVDDSHVLLRTPRQHNMYSIDLNNIVPHKNLTCLIAKASVDESMMWHRRLGHLNFKTMNKLVRNNLVRGLPSKSFENDHTCVACLKGKQHKASCKTKLVNSVSKPLHTLHIDLFGPTSVSSLNHKWYCLVVTADFFRCDNRGEFKNREMDEFYTKKGIKREFSNARTPQQNGVAERRNRTLIEVTRTMLVDAKLPVTFWAEAVSTACYVQNMVLVNKCQNKTPYELFNGRSPAIGFLRPFGCHVMILNALDHLGKFDAKGDEGYFVGYSLSSKAFRVFNKRTKKVEENLHEDFLEKKPIEKGAGPNWLFDIDSLTNSMIMHSEANDDPQKEQDGTDDVSKSSGNTTPTASSKDSLADQVEPILSPTVESKVPIDSSLVPTYGTNVLDSESPELPASLTVETTVPTVSIPIPTGSKSIPPITSKEPKKIVDALKDESWVEAMQEELLQFQIQNVWVLVDWRTHEEGIDYEEVFAPVARIEAIRLFLVYASYMGFTVYQMDVKSVFLYGTIDEEVYVMQPPGFEDPEFPDKVYMVEKAMYGLYQEPRACYMANEDENHVLVEDDVVPTEFALMAIPTTLDLSYSGLEEFKEPEVNEYGPRNSSLKPTTGCDKEPDKSKENTDDSLEQHQITDTETSIVKSSLKVSDDEDEVESHVVKTNIPTAAKIEKPVRKPVRYAEMYMSQRPRGNQRNWNGQKSNQLGCNFVFNNKACFICGSFDHLQYTCKHKRHVNDQKQVKPVWNNSKRLNHHYLTRITHPNPKRNFVPKAVLMKTRMRPVNAAKSKVAYNVVKRNRFNDVKASACWVWMPKNRVIYHVSKYNNASVTLKRLDYIDAKEDSSLWMHRLRGGKSAVKKKKNPEKREDCWELNTSELVLPSQQLVLLEENSLYCSRLQLPVLNQSVNTARITAVGEKVNAAESLLVVSTKVNAD
ncbi:putative ribonuclease H-like domain-containing protein [Tanacetum coccineum]